MPKPAQRVSEVRPRQAVFAASIKQFPKRLVLLTEGDSWFSYPLNANIADYIEMMSDFSMLRLEHNGDDARDIMGAGSDQLKPFLAKIAALFVFTLAFRFAEPLARIADWQAFAVAFVGAALFVAVGGIVAVLLQRGSSSREAKPA